jgi:two-component system response regulator LytT
MNILIVEDEAKTARLLKELIEGCGAEYKVAAICDSVESTVEYIKSGQQAIHLFFMDIMLADGNSFDIFRQVSITAPVIFCTAFDDYILKAFKHNGIDYILKPFQEKDIEGAFAKIETLKQSLVINEAIARQIAEGIKPAAAPQNSFLVRFRDKMYPVQVKDVALITLENGIVYLYTFNNEKHPLFKPIDDIEAVVDPSVFFRINRQMLINRNAVMAIEPFFNRKVMVKTNVITAEKPVVSRLKVSAFLQWVEKG